MRAYLFATLATASIACGDNLGEDDAFATSKVSDFVESNSELARLVTPLEGGDLTGFDEATARAQAVMKARDGFELLVRKECLDLTTDDTTFIEVTFDQCEVLLNTIDGSLRADFTIELDGGGLPTALIVDVSTPRLSSVGPRRSRELSGTFALRKPIAGPAPVQFEGELEVVNDDGDRVSLSANAEWTVDGGCVAFTGAAQLTGDVLGDRGPISLSARGIVACRNRCPSEGDVQLAYGAGTLLAWSYDGTETATVRGPGGKLLEVALACGDDG